MQLALHEDLKPLVTISTHRGLYRYNRLPFAVATAPAIFQRTMHGNFVRGIPGVCVFIDDILVWVLLKVIISKPKREYFLA